ncbi:MAG: hypothetical protein U0941_28845 [Planctomycetaceae bacterium]
MITNWKRSLISGVAALAVAAFVPQQADAQHHHHGGGHGGGHYSSGHSGGHHGGGLYAGHHHHSTGHLHLGYGEVGYGGYVGSGYSPTYGSGYVSSGVNYYTPPVVVQNVVPSNVVPYSIQTSSNGTVANGGTIKIVNPSDSGGEVSYTLNGNPYSIKPGHAQTIQNDRLWTVAFGSGGTTGNVRYSLQPGFYKFKVTDGGWNLFLSQEQAAVASNALPPAPEPMLLDDEPRSARIPIPQP